MSQAACTTATFLLKQLPAFLLAVIVLTPAVQAQGLRRVFDDLVRGTARVADEVPVKNIDELVDGLRKSRKTRDVVDAELRNAGRLGEAGDVVRGAARSDEVLQLLRASTTGLDPSVIRRIEKLDDASRDVALVLSKGGDELSRTVPDLAARGRLVRAGGLDTVAAVGMFGPDAARTALRLDEAIKGGSVIIKNGGRAVTVADFGAAMTRHGDNSWRFWQKYIQPHWKIWAASGALAAYLTNPEYFQDAAGRLTEAGTKRLTELAGKIAAAAIRGVGEGSGNAAKQVAAATRDTFFKSSDGMYAFAGTVIFLACIALFFRRIRYWVFWPLRWLNGSPKNSKTPNPNR